MSAMIQSLASIQPKWLVDVQARCIVPADTHHAYIALSYVWGQGTRLETLKGNIDDLRRPGSLADSNASIHIPKTIRHAMAVVEIIGERYLWVDALCIVQDDDAQKRHEISNMAGIYANASLTIVAEDGRSADDGLCGLRGVSEPRQFHQLVTPLQGSTRALHLPDPELHASLWHRRGWTLQERLFSGRRLIFRDDYVRWECQRCRWREDSTLNHDVDIRVLSKHVTDINQTDITRLIRLINDINTREFTFPGDILPAFAGIATAYSTSLPGGFISGLPTAFFHNALLWEPWMTPLIRRGEGLSSPKVCLPSWSWAGWEGRLWLDIWKATKFPNNTSEALNEDAILPTVEWSYHDKLGSGGTAISVRSERSDKDHERAQNLIESLDCHAEGTVHPRAKSYDRPDGSMILVPFISGDTRRTWLSSTEPVFHERFSDRGPDFVVLRDPQNRLAGYIYLDAELTNDSDGHTPGNAAHERSFELVELAKRYMSGYGVDGQPLWTLMPPTVSLPAELYCVMWIEWNDGIAYRKGIGKVLANIWEEQEPETIHLMLG